MTIENVPRPSAEGPGQSLNAVRVDEGLDRFLDDLRRQESLLFGELQRLLRQPDKPPRVAALGIYLDAMLKATVFEVDPFAPRFPGDEEHQADRRAIAGLATAQLVQSWITEHPESHAARAVARLNLSASAQDHQELMRELWSTFLAALAPQAKPRPTEPS